MKNSGGEKKTGGEKNVVTDPLLADKDVPLLFLATTEYVCVVPIVSLIFIVVVGAVTV